MSLRIRGSRPGKSRPRSKRRSRTCSRIWRATRTPCSRSARTGGMCARGGRGIGGMLGSSAYQPARAVADPRRSEALRDDGDLLTAEQAQRRCPARSPRCAPGGHRTHWASRSGRYATPSPRIERTEDAAVKRLPMRQVVVAGKGLRRQRGEGESNDVGLGLREFPRIVKSEVVAQDTGAWIDIRILRHRAEQLSSGGGGG